MNQPHLTFFTVATPNTWPIAVALEELEIPYRVRLIDMQRAEHRGDWYTKVNPAGRIPAIVDHQRGDFAVFESSAILLYLAQHYDKTGKISYNPEKEPDLYSEQLQWLFFTHGSYAPMQGQAIHFERFAPERHPYSIKRFVGLSKRFLKVLDKRLEDREWLAGDRYTLADIKTFPWASKAPASGLDLNEFPNAWLRRIEARPKTSLGMRVPTQEIPAFITYM